MNVNEREGGEDLGGVAGGKIVIRTYYIKSIFIKNMEKLEI